MTAYWMHRDPNAFPDPHAFIPERWLQDKNDKAIAECYVPFGRGSRDCLGKKCVTFSTVL